MKGLSFIGLLLLICILLASTISFANQAQAQLSAYKVTPRTDTVKPYNNIISIEKINSPTNGQSFNQNDEILLEVEVKSTFKPEVKAVIKNSVNTWEVKMSKKMGVYTAKFSNTDKVDKYDIEFVAENMFGQDKKSIFINVLDSTPPKTTDNAPTGWAQGPITVTLDCTDSDSGCDKTYYCVDIINECTPNVEGAQVTLTQEDVNYVRYFSTDNAGNQEDVNSAEVKIDDTPPVTSFQTYGSNGPLIWTSSVDITLTCDDPLSGCYRTYYCTDLTGDCIPNTVYTKTVTVSTEGKSYIRFNSEDFAANSENVQTLEIIIDSISPILTPVSPIESNVYTTGDIDYIIQANEDLDWATYRIGSNSANQLTYNPASGNWESLAGSHITLPDGKYIITFEAEDVAGNPATPTTVNFEVSTGPSTVDCTSGPDCSAKLNGDYEVVRLINDISDCSGNCIVFNADNIAFDGNNHVIDGTGSDNGIKLNGYSGVSVQNAEVKEFDMGIDATNSNSATIIDNHVHHNHAGGIWLQNGDNHIVKDNLVEWTNMDGIGIAFSNHNTIENNVIQINSNNGIWIFGSSQNTINDNVIFGNGDSIGEYGINILSGSSNTLFNNNLKSNFYNAIDLGSSNVWNSAYPDGGNYWTDFDQESEGCYDNYSGTNQDIPGSDDICDTPYPNGVSDNFPFKKESGWL